MFKIALALLIVPTGVIVATLFWLAQQVVKERREAVERQRRERLAHYIEAAKRVRSIGEHALRLYTDEEIIKMNTVNLRQIEKTITKVTVTNCPNCGAPHTGKDVCEYCGTKYTKIGGE